MECEICHEAEATTSPCDFCDGRDGCKSAHFGMRTCQFCADQHLSVVNGVGGINSLLDKILGLDGVKAPARLFSKLPVINRDDILLAKAYFKDRLNDANMKNDKAGDIVVNPIADMLDEIGGESELAKVIFSNVKDLPNVEGKDHLQTAIGDFALTLLVVINNAMERQAHNAEQAQIDSVARKLLDQIE